MFEIVITMAGLGARFRRQGYRVPKYRALARGRPLFDWALESLGGFLGAGARLSFVMLRQDGAADFVRTRALALGARHVEIIEIDALTDGQATSALLAGQALRDPSAPFLIYNIDTHVDPGALPPSSVRGDGWIPCFPGEGDAWSFVALGADGRACEVREKVRISPHATIGLYHFADFRLYADLYAATYGAGETPAAGERYVAPMYNALIGRGGAVHIHEIPATALIPLGTPEEVRRFDPSAGPDKVL